MLQNERRGEHGSTSASTSAEVQAFHRSMPDYRSTPLIEVPGIAARLGVARCWVKDESDRLGMPSFKILGASWATFRALCEFVGRDHRGVDGLAGLTALLDSDAPTLVAATDGNHGRAVARMARLLGLGAHILVPSDMVQARIEALRGEGARVTIVPGPYDDAVAESSRLADAQNLVISDTSWEGYEAIPRWVVDGYATIPREALAQVDAAGSAPPTVAAVQMGVGSFAAAIVRGLDPSTTIVGVEPTRAACVLAGIEAGEPRQTRAPQDSIMAGLNCGTPSRVAWNDLVSGIDWFTTVTDRDAEDSMRALAAEGLVSGESGAAGLAGLLVFGHDIGLRPTDRVLVFSTEGATDPDSYRRITATDLQDLGEEASCT